ncbi:hypothetical protein ABZ470_26425 [Streptosporangium sp. NPDC020072]|uniref:hypothetical protein n=1 Tax=Streptosporangium sp. NPDC020072 TaxID=3154788 RepID=UPI00342406B9
MLSVLLAAVIPAVATAVPASAEACGLTVQTPYWSNSRMHTKGTMSCSSNPRAVDLDIQVQLLENGSAVGYDEKGCWGGYASCSASTSAPNHAGDQVWCVLAIGYYDGYEFDKAYSCEQTGY